MPGKGKPFPPGKRSAGRPFVKGDERVKDRKGQPKPGQMLLDMRHVYRVEKESDDATPGQRMFRKLYEESPSKFVEQYMKFEAEFRNRLEEFKREKRQGMRKEREEADPGCVRLVELCDQLLAEVGRKAG